MLAQKPHIAFATYRIFGLLRNLVFVNVPLGSAFRQETFNFLLIKTR